jgi:hypothetical protein
LAKGAENAHIAVARRKRAEKAQSIADLRDAAEQEIAFDLRRRFHVISPQLKDTLLSLARAAAHTKFNDWASCYNVQ